MYYFLTINQASISNRKNRIVTNTSINCSGVASPENTALKETFSFSRIFLGVRSFIIPLNGKTLVKVLLLNKK